MDSVWVALAGGVGGAVIGAIAKQPLRPSIYRAPPRLLVRPGALVCIAVGALTAAIVVRLFEPVGFLWASALGGAIVGATAAGWVTSETDKRMLHAAATLAAAAPAAHPKTVEEVAVKPPHEVLAIASELAHRSYRR